MKTDENELFFSVTVPPAPENLHPVITRDMAEMGWIHIDDLLLSVHSEKVAMADELFECLEEAVYKTCYFCLEGNLLDPTHAGESCPFNQKEPCIVNKWKSVLYRAGKAPSFLYAKFKCKD